MIWNKLRAFQNEGWVQHVKNVTGRMVSVEGAVGCLEVLEEQCVMCSLVWLPQKGSVREPWILRLVDRKPGCPVWQQIHDSLQWWRTGSDTYYIKTAFSEMEILSLFSQLRCRVMTLLVMNLQRYKVYPPRLLELVISIICLGKNYYYIQEKSGLFSNHLNKLTNYWRLSWYFLHHSLEKRSRSV